VEVKAGTRLRSTACQTEVVVVKAPPLGATIECGGLPMAPLESAVPQARAPRPGFEGGNAVGKRYVDEAETVEVLCTKPGQGALALGGQLLSEKAAKPLPSSD